MVLKMVVNMVFLTHDCVQLQLMCAKPVGTSVWGPHCVGTCVCVCEWSGWVGGALLGLSLKAWATWLMETSSLPCSRWPPAVKWCNVHHHGYLNNWPPKHTPKDVKVQLSGCGHTLTWHHSKVPFRAPPLQPSNTFTATTWASRGWAGNRACMGSQG